MRNRYVMHASGLWKWRKWTTRASSHDAMLATRRGLTTCFDNSPRARRFKIHPVRGGHAVERRAVQASCPHFHRLDDGILFFPESDRLWRGSEGSDLI